MLSVTSYILLCNNQRKGEKKMMIQMPRVARLLVNSYMRSRANMALQFQDFRFNLWVKFKRTCWQICWRYILSHWAGSLMQEDLSNEMNWQSVWIVKWFWGNALCCFRGPWPVQLTTVSPGGSMPCQSPGGLVHKKTYSLGRWIAKQHPLYTLY